MGDVARRFAAPLLSYILYPCSPIFCLPVEQLSCGPSSLIDCQINMALVGKMEAEVEIKSDADEIFHIFGGKVHSISNVCAERVQKVEVVEGDWGTHGSTRFWTYVAEGKVETLKEKLSIDEENKTLSATALEGDLLEHLKKYKATLQVIQRGDTSFANFTIEYEKRKEDVPAPQKYLDFLVNAVKDIDAKLVNKA